MNKKVPCSILPDDPLQLQFNLMAENLVRSNLGKVWHKHLLLSHPAKGITTMREILRLLSLEGYNVLVSNDRCDFEIFHPELCAKGYINLDEGGRVNYVSFEIYAIIDNKFESLIRSKGFRNWTPRRADTQKETEVIFAFPSMGQPQYKSKTFANLPLNTISCNYSAEVIDKTRALIDYANEVEHGLVVLNGPVGTGKSYLIRSILTEINMRRTAVICNPATTFLNDIALLQAVAVNFDRSFLVFEDIGDILTIKAYQEYIDVKSNLLNISEGFLSLLMDTIILVSFNYDIKNIDPAVIRPGRCLANINVDLLPYNHARKLVSFDIPEKDYSLAEIYELRKQNKEAR